jgi:hypothetical protein
MSRGLRNTFLAHFVVSLIFGLSLYFMPKTYESITNWDPIDPAFAHTMGAALLGLAVSSYLGFRASTWDQVRIIVMQEIVFTILGALAGLYLVFTVGAPAMIWMNILIFAVFAGLWVYFYLKHS